MMNMAFTTTAGFAMVGGFGAASPARRSVSSPASAGGIAFARPLALLLGHNTQHIVKPRVTFASSCVLRATVRQASRRAPSSASMRISIARAGDDPPGPGDEGKEEEEEEEELDTDKLLKELTDTSQLGGRGEVFFLGQMLLIFLLVFTPGGGSIGGLETVQKDAFDPLIGLVLLALSGLLIFKRVPFMQGVKDLGNSLTPFPKPRSDNILKTSGAYAVVRHPMYSGLAFGGFGLAVVTGSPVRTCFAVCLAALLNFKAASEEEYLAEMHGADVYGEYASKVPRLIPNVEGIGNLLEDTFDGSFSEEGKNI